MINKPSILCIDDEPEITKALSFLLNDDFQVYTANSSTEALNIIKKNPRIILIISDQRMPDMTGCQVLKEIMKINPDTFRIILSGYADFKELKPNVENAVIHKILTKPWDPYSLLMLLKNLIDDSFRTPKLIN